MNILDKILETKRREMAAAKAALNFGDIFALAQAVNRPVASFSAALAASPTGIIAEFKRRSPSKGFIKEGADAAAIVGGYARNGAAAISVLTDRDYFAGSLDDLRTARRVVDALTAAAVLAGGAERPERADRLDAGSGERPAGSGRLGERSSRPGLRPVQSYLPPLTGTSLREMNLLRSVNSLRSVRKRSLTIPPTGLATSTPQALTGLSAEPAAPPLLRKDFVIDPYQICEARIAGADVVLLIAAALTVPQCAELAAFAAALGLEVLLEVHNEAELDHISDHVDVVGVNNRNLGTFITDTGVSKRLAGLLPRDIVRISESGVSTPETVRELRAVGYRGFLMGENFMKRTDPAAALGEFINELQR